MQCIKIDHLKEFGNHAQETTLFNIEFRIKHLFCTATDEVRGLLLEKYVNNYMIFTASQVSPF